FFKQLVHAAFFLFTDLLFALELARGTALEPALPETRPARPGRLVALQAGVPLREIIAEQRFLAAGLQKDILLPARRIDEQRQAQKQHIILDDSVDADHQHGDEAGEDRRQGGLVKAQTAPQGTLKHAAAVERKTDQDHIQQEEQPIDPEKASHMEVPQ